MRAVQLAQPGATLFKAAGCSAASHPETFVLLFCQFWLTSLSDASHRPESWCTVTHKQRGFFPPCSLCWPCNRFNSITLQVHGTWYTMSYDAIRYPAAVLSVSSSCETCCQQKEAEERDLKSLRPLCPFARDSVRLLFSFSLPITDTWSPHRSAQLFLISLLDPPPGCQFHLCTSVLKKSQFTCFDKKKTTCIYGKKGTFKNKDPHHSWLILQADILCF